jgi:hypothetical protein
MADELRSGSPTKENGPPAAESKPAVSAVADKAPAKGGQSTTEQTSTVQENVATEKPTPVGLVKKHSLYVLRVDDETGSLVKIEKLDETTQERKELTPQEYALAWAYAGASLQLAGTITGYASAAAVESQSIVQAYYQGMIDYLNACSPPR